jgi:O-acetyl-ADP-ribose deacetylase (regulator of RNase III)
MNKIEGDLLQLAINGEFDVIIHGCNCQCVMGKGIALSIKKKFPQAYEADRKTQAGSSEKLGTFSFAKIETNAHCFTVVNAYIQYHWRGQGTKVDYDALKNVMLEIKSCFSGKKIGYPLIGAGLAGGDWSIIYKIIDKELDGEDHTLVIFKS